MERPIKQQIQIIRPPLAKPINVVIYLRLSRDDELQGESASITNQRLMLEKYCKENGFTIAGEYVDDGYSGTNFDRPGFQRLLDDIEAGKVSCIITKDLSRLGRNYIQTGYYIELYFPAKGVRYIAVSDNIDTDKGDSDSMPILNVINEFQARLTSRKITSSLGIKIANSAIFGTYAAFGYIKNPQKKAHIIPDDETKGIVKDIFTMAAHGAGPTKIRNELIRRKIPIPSWWIYKRTGLFAEKYKDQPEDVKYGWTDEKVRRILSDQVYIGNSIHYRQTKVSFKSKKTIRHPEEEWLIVKNTHEPIISTELWEKAQAHIQSRKRPTKQGTVQIFAGLLRCADCGHSLGYSCRKDTDGNITREFYSCKSYRKYGKDRCSIHYVRYETLYEAVKAKLQYFNSFAKLDREAMISRLIKNSTGQYEKDIEISKKELANAEKRIKAIDRTFAKLYEDRMSGNVTERNYIQLSEKYQNEQAELEKKITELKASIEKTVCVETNAEKWTDIIGKYDNITELTAPMLNELIDKIVVHESTTDENGDSFQQIDIYYHALGKIE